MATVSPIKLKRTIAAPAAEVYRALTHATALRDWLADAAQSEARIGGRLYLWWNDGFYANGRFSALVPGKKVAFSWHGSGEPEASRVSVALAEKDGKTAVSLTHSGLGTGKQWSGTRQAIADGWESGLENLQSVLESGVDLRLARVPRLGIFIDDFNPEFAARVGVPAKAGIRVAGTAEGSGAQAAGLQKDDVIVRLGGKATTDFASLRRALEGRQAGESVAVVYYRGAEKQSTPMTLSARPPQPPAPPTGAALAEAAQQSYAAMLADLRQRLEGVSEAEAERRPAPAEWSLKELVAHFIACERDLQAWIADMLNDNTVGDSLEFRPNVTLRLAALVRRYPTIPALLDELKAASDETVALLAALPEAFVRRRHMYQRVAQWIMFVVPSHLPDEHGAQFTETLRAARADA
jgi:uncharacterized protein YndB with AHSA1/START domain